MSQALPDRDADCAGGGGPGGRSTWGRKLLDERQEGEGGGAGRAGRWGPAHGGALLTRVQTLGFVLGPL